MYAAWQELLRKRTCAKCGSPIGDFSTMSGVCERCFEAKRKEVIKDGRP
jgi:NMD protein affecting ribosome stability and mRNA decay